MQWRVYILSCSEESIMFHMLEPANKVECSAVVVNVQKLMQIE